MGKKTLEKTKNNIIEYRKAVIVLILLVFPMNIFADSSINVHVSILPQKYFVEKIGKERVKVNVLVKPGKSPATYAPAPDQIKKLNMSDIYFKIGVPFENSILHKIQLINKTQIIDTNRDIVLRDMTKHNHNSQNGTGHGHSTGQDPHTWMDPLIVKTQAHIIFQTLLEYDSKFNPEFNLDVKKEYEENYFEFIRELDKLDKRLHAILKELKGKNIFVFHPFLGYFTDAYGLKQVAIETMGKAPRGKELSKFIKLARKEKIKTIFVQPQFDKNAAQKIASIINGRVISIDPLAYDYLANMENIGTTIAQQLKKNN
jgi:zinc transport system substrate-binding protein